MTPTTTWELITPDTARQWLPQMARNRRPSNGTVLRYAKDMREGRWTLSDSAIVWTTDGKLINGQHRLLACIVSDTPFWSNVTRNAPPEAMPHLDGGKPRDPADQLAILGHPNARQLQAVARAYLAYRAERHRVWNANTVILTKDDIVLEVDKHPDEYQHHVATGRRCSPLASGTVVATLERLVWEESDYPDQWDTFIDGLATGANLAPDSPVLAYRTHLMLRRDPTNRARPTLWGSNQGDIHLIIKMWNNHATGRPTRRATYPTSQQLPMPTVR